MPTSTRINPAFRADVGIRPYDYDALNNHLYAKRLGVNVHTKPFLYS